MMTPVGRERGMLAAAAGAALVAVATARSGIDGIPCWDKSPKCTQDFDPATHFKRIITTSDIYTAEYYICKRHGNETVVLDLLQADHSTPLFSQLVCLSDADASCLPEMKIPVSTLAKLSDPDYAAAYIASCGQNYTQLDVIIAGGVFAALPGNLMMEYHYGDHSLTPSNHPGFIVMMTLVAIVLALGALAEFISYTKAHAASKAPLYEGDAAINSGTPLVSQSQTKKNSTPKLNLENFIQLFNPSKNLNTLFTSSPARSLGGLDGMRSISMLWIILAHTSLLSTLIQNEDPDAEIKFFTSPVKSLVIGGEYAVDTFFFISGMLTAYSLTKKLRVKIKPIGAALPQGAFFTLFRFLRLTPVYAFILFVYAYIAPQLSSGPFWYKMISESSLCEDKWWTNLLYINNFYPDSFHNQCMSWTWYLANDMQFFIVALILINIYIRMRNVSVAIQATLIVSQTVMGYVIMKDNMQHMQDWYYDKPYMRIVPLIAGLLMGCALRDTNMAKRKLTRVQAGIPMLLSIVSILFLCIINSTEYKDVDNDPTKAKVNWTPHQQAAYLTFGRLLFIISITTITYLCISGNGGFVARFLGKPWWEPIGKLTYGAYLVHPALIRVFYFSQVHFFYISNSFNGVVVFLGIAATSYAFSIVTYTMIELPFEGLFKMILL